MRKDDKAPLKGADVQLENDEDRDRTIAAKTGADGRFELHNLPAGQYRLSVSRNGYVHYWYGQKKSSDPGATFTLRTGQTMSDLVFELSRAAVIAGRIFNEDGEPVANAVVSALMQAYRDGRRQLDAVNVRTSDDRGEFRLFGLRPGRYFISVQPQIWNRVVGDREFSDSEKQTSGRAYARSYYPGVTNPAKASSIAVREGQEASAIDILMREVTVYRIRGRVVNLISRHGNREMNLHVTGRGQDVGWDFVAGRSGVKPDGSFEIPDILPGEYTVSAFFWDEEKLYSGQEDVDVVNADANGVTITIGPGINVPGQVVWEGKPSLEAGEAAVSLGPMQDGSLWNGSSRVGSDGQFTLKDVHQGAFRISVEGLSKDCYVKEIRQGDSVLTDDVFHAARGNSSPLEITVSSRGGRVEGMVTNEDSLPVAGVWVVAVPEESKRKLHRHYKASTTDQYGHFNLRGMAPGNYALFAWDGIEPDEWEDADFLKPFEDKGATVEVKDAATQSVELKVMPVKESAAEKE